MIKFEEFRYNRKYKKIRMGLAFLSAALVAFMLFSPLMSVSALGMGSLAGIALVGLIVCSGLGCAAWLVKNENQLSRRTYKLTQALEALEENGKLNINQQKEINDLIKLGVVKVQSVQPLLNKEAQNQQMLRAFWAKDDDIAQIWIDSGADPDGAIRNEQLLSANMANDLDKIQRWIALGAKDPGGAIRNEKLKQALEAGDFEASQRWIVLGADRTSVLCHLDPRSVLRIRDRDQKRTFQNAFAMLIDSGADPDAVIRNEKLGEALAAGNYNQAQALIRLGADADKKIRNEAFKDSFSAHNYEWAQALIRLGADVAVADLGGAIRNRALEEVLGSGDYIDDTRACMLISLGASISIRSLQQKACNKGLEKLLKKDEYKRAQALIGIGADVDVADSGAVIRNEKLGEALAAGNYNQAQALIDLGADEKIVVDNLNSIPVDIVLHPAERGAAHLNPVVLANEKPEHVKKKPGHVGFAEENNVCIFGGQGPEKEVLQAMKSC